MRGAGRAWPARPCGAARPGSVQTVARGAWFPAERSWPGSGRLLAAGPALLPAPAAPRQGGSPRPGDPQPPCFLAICRRGRKSLAPGPICGGQGREQEARGIGLPAHLSSACRSPRRRRSRRGREARPGAGQALGSSRVQDPPPGLMLLLGPDHPGVEKHARAGPTVSPWHPGSPPTGPTRTPCPRRQPVCVSLDPRGRHWGRRTWSQAPGPWEQRTVTAGPSRSCRAWRRLSQRRTEGGSWAGGPLPGVWGQGGLPGLPPGQGLAQARRPQGLTALPSWDLSVCLRTPGR